MRPACPACGVPLILVHVHGHGQCAQCGTNVEPCCSGAGDEAEAAQPPRLEVAPQVFEQLFEELGGRASSVAAEALLNAFSRAQGTDLDEARAVVGVAVRLGILARHPADSDAPVSYRLR